MNREHEKQAPFLHDSWHRLAWVEEQVERVRSIAEPWMMLPRDAPTISIIDESASRDGHLEFSVAVEQPPELPATVNFLIGNIVTDARSCLDMAMDGLWRHYELERRGIQVQFPLEDNYSEKRDNNKLGAGLRKFLAQLDERFVEVIEDAQVDYAGGLLDIPSNLSAIFISKLSNANKHRNITPAVVRIVLSSTATSERGLSLIALDADSRQGLPPIRFALDYDPATYSDEDARSYVLSPKGARATPLQITFTQRLIVDRQEIPLYPPRFEARKLAWRAELDDLLTKVPAYVRLTLRNLNRVHRVIEEDNNGFYMLDADGTF